MKFFDSHAHYYDARFAAETAGADELLEELFAGSVSGVVNVGTSLENAPVVVAQAAKFPLMYAAVGIHPTDGQSYPDPYAAVAELKKFLGDVKSRAARKILAVGEIGLDYHYEDTDRAKQAVLLEEQLKLAVELDLPVIIHDREAHGDCFEAILRHPRARVLFHSYSGSAELARELVRRGCYLSFSGVCTFKNAPRVREAIAAVPWDRLMIETDCPYLSPVPHRGEINHSGYLCHTAKAVGEVLGVPTETVAEMTAANARRFFSIP